MRRFVLAALIGAATVAFTGVALAGSTTTEPGMLYAVVKKADGGMFYSPDGVYDPDKEALISWNQQGVQGPVGPAGEQGPPGPPGPAAESDVTVTKGNFTVAVGETVSETLPLTGITITGTIEIAPPEYGGYMLARPRLNAEGNMDAFVVGVTYNPTLPGAGPGIQQLVLPPVSSDWPDSAASYTAYMVIATANGATATITFGGTADKNAGVCTFTWLAVEK
jgi:hypothetical protein